VPDRERFLDYLLPIHRSYRPRRDPLPVFTDAQLQAITVPLRVTGRLLPHAIVTVLPDAGHSVTQDVSEIHPFLDDAINW
jgi:hypothetical protein